MPYSPETSFVKDKIWILLRTSCQLSRVMINHTRICCAMSFSEFDCAEIPINHQLVIQSRQESKEEQSKSRYRIYNEEQRFKPWIHEKFHVWCDRSVSRLHYNKQGSKFVFVVHRQPHSHCLINVHYPKCVFEYFGEKSAFRWEELHWLCLFVARTIKPHAVSRTQLNFFAHYVFWLQSRLLEINALSFSFEIAC